MGDWYRETFGEMYAELYAHRDESEARRTVDLIESALDLRCASSVLDAPCGSGRHARELARRGHRVVALDLSTALLSSAAKAPHEGVGFLRGDIRSLPLHANTFGAVLNLFSSIGYFASDEENLSVLGELARVCRTGGALVLDFFNEPWLRSNLVAEGSRETPAGWVVREARRIQGTPPRVEKRTVVTLPDGSTREMRESVRLFSPGELGVAMERAGIQVTSRHGGYDGSPWSEHSPRLIFMGRKR